MSNPEPIYSWFQEITNRRLVVSVWPGVRLTPASKGVGRSYSVRVEGRDGLLCQDQPMAAGAIGGFPWRFGVFAGKKKKRHNLKVENYFSFGDITENYVTTDSPM